MKFHGAPDRGMFSSIYKVTLTGCTRSDVLGNAVFLSLVVGFLLATLTAAPVTTYRCILIDHNKKQTAEDDTERGGECNYAPAHIVSLVVFDGSAVMDNERQNMVNGAYQSRTPGLVWANTSNTLS